MCRQVFCWGKLREKPQGRAAGDLEKKKNLKLRREVLVAVKHRGKQQLTAQLWPCCLNAPWRNFLDIVVFVFLQCVRCTCEVRHRWKF